MATSPQQTASAAEIDRIHQLIVEEPKRMANRLPEQIFRDYFLPVFAGDVPNGKHYEEWISIAGAPSAEVAILGENGQVLFNVPPLMNTDHIKRIRPEGAIPFASIVSMSEAFRGKSGAAADQQMTTDGMRRYRASHDSNHDYTPEEKRWLEIFQRYGIVSAASNVETPAAPEAQKPNAIDDDEFVES